MERKVEYTAPAIALHWLVALLIFAGYGLGEFMTGLAASPEKLQLYSWHKWIGVSVFLLAVVRVGWRVLHPAPPLSTPMPALQRLAADITHVGLYLLMFLIPLSGWLYSSASGYQTVYFGLIPLPNLIDKNAGLADALRLAHVLLNYVLAAMVLAHFAAALKHHWLDRDGLLGRMLPGKATSSAAAVSVLSGLALAGLLYLSLGKDEHEHEHEAAAAPVQTSNSGDIGVQFKQMGVGVDAKFTSFTVEASFDPANPAAGSAVVKVDTASFDLGDAEYNSEVRKAEWLDSSAFPQASFTSSAIRALGDNRYEVEGQFTLKGKTQPLTVPFTVAEDAAGLRYQGRFEVSRAAYAIGDASWSDMLDDAVAVQFNVVVPKGAVTP